MSNIDLSQLVTAEDKAATARAALERAIDVERDRRLALPLAFAGHLFQFGPDSRENIQGAASSATIAVAIEGAVEGDLLWHGGADPFVFLDRDNVPVPMDAQTVIAFGQAAAGWKSAHIFAGRALKDMEAIPADFAADPYWPAP